MTAFHQRSWTQREKALGDEAESVFEAVQTKGFARYGINRPPVQVHKLHLMVRYTPDYMRSTELVEVMGAGRDQVLKHEKLSALQMWDALIMPTHLFVWDSHQRRHGECRIGDLPIGGVPVGKFPEGKAFYGIPLGDLPVEWRAHAEAA